MKSPLKLGKKISLYSRYTKSHKIQTLYTGTVDEVVSIIPGNMIKDPLAIGDCCWFTSSPGSPVVGITVVVRNLISSFTTFVER